MKRYIFYKQNHLKTTLAFILSSLLFDSINAYANEDVVERMDEDTKAGKPLVAHIVVALCDNVYQGIVPVSQSWGDGDKASTNLYWGALFGVKTYFGRHKDWSSIKIDKPENSLILDRALFSRKIKRKGVETTVYVVADAWQGRKIKNATEYFLNISAGNFSEKIVTAESSIELGAGGSAHLVAYVGHNGLMDFSLSDVPTPATLRSSSSSVVLACASKNYFNGLLSITGSFPLITTTGLMAPEAYTLEAIITAWFSGSSKLSTRDAAANAYAKYQKANLNWSKKLFSTVD